MKLLKNKQLIGGAFSMLLSIVLTSLVIFNIPKLFELRVSDFLYHSSPTDKNIVIISIDAKTLDVNSGLGDFSKWTRSNYAKVIENLDKASPKVIGVDIFFRDSKDKEGDATLAKTLMSVVNPVVLGSFISQQNYDNSLGKYTIANHKGMLPQSDFLMNEHVSSAYLNLPANQDQVVRGLITRVFDTTDKIQYDAFAFAISKIVGAQEIDRIDPEILINFFSDPFRSDLNSNYLYISFIDVLNGKFDPAQIQNKIVLIGPTEEILQDYVVTPASYTYKMPGVEVHANAIQTILEKKFLRYMYDWEKILLIILFSFASVFVFSYTRIRWSLLYLVGMAGGYTLLAPVLFDRGLIVDLVHPYLALAGAFVSVYMYRYVTEFREKRELKGAFSKYVNPAIVNQIMAHPEQLKLGGEQRMVTVIFTDIRGFTTISEKLSPESLVALLNEYLEKMSTVIFDEGGTVDKYEGDAILAFFGAPLAQADHAARACTAVLKMRKALVELNAKWATDPPLPGGEKKPQIEFRAGISAGKVIVGNIGSTKKLNYTVIGDNVNLGSRLESVNKKYGTNILMSEDTFTLVKELFITREVDRIRVMGKKNPVRIYELLANKALSDQAVDYTLLKLYEEGIGLYKERKFAEGLAKFDEILKSFPDDNPSKLYRQRCEVLRDFPPAANWDGVYEMGEK